MESVLGVNMEINFLMAEKGNEEENGNAFTANEMIWPFAFNSLVPGRFEGNFS